MTGRQAWSSPDHSQEEERFLLFGVSEKGKFLVISFTETEHAIRIFSARLMTPPERKAYEQR
ncbi:BrnT family toxin [uncultured Lamprocystis sp.]|uniref:BrnT family toxin n=1 Tax=uncultured Lamprocystis sp. TaxID=543132 RepID=UPI003432C413